MAEIRELQARCDSLLVEYQDVTATLTALNAHSPRIVGKYVEDSRYRAYIKAKAEHEKKRAELVAKKNMIVVAMRKAKSDLHDARNYGPRRDDKPEATIDNPRPKNIGPIDPIHAEMLLRRALGVLVDLNADSALIQEIRDYCMGAAQLPPTETAAIPRTELEPLPTGPSQVKFMDASNRQAAGPGAVLYGRNRA